MTAEILHHPCFGNPPVANIKHRGDSRRLKVIQLTKARRMALCQKREQQTASGTAESKQNRAVPAKVDFVLRVMEAAKVLDDTALEAVVGLAERLATGGSAPPVA